jgi:hypothetical protein
MPNPLSDERLAEIDGWLGYMPLDPFHTTLQAARDLRAEVKRLKLHLKLAETRSDNPGWNE